MIEQYPKQYLYRRIVRAKLFIDEHFSQPIDLRNVSGEACFSRFHFARLFRDIYGMTPHRYLTSVRIDKARDLLENGASVKKACYAVGFDSVASFTALFKRRLGLTPAAYQRVRQERSHAIALAPLRHIPNCFAEKKGWIEK